MLTFLYKTLIVTGAAVVGATAVTYISKGAMEKAAENTLKKIHDIEEAAHLKRQAEKA